MDQHKLNSLFITYHSHKKRTLNWNIHLHTYDVMFIFSVLLMLCLYSVNDVTSMQNLHTFFCLRLEIKPS